MQTNKVDKKYLDRIKNVDFQPIFILGLHRSGTSILYKILAETHNFNQVTAYHLIKYNEILSNFIENKQAKEKKQLTEYIRSKGQKDRGIDRLQIDSDFAEEYGFLLGKYSNKYYLDSKNYQYFYDLSKKIQYISENKKPLLLKNPYDFDNFLYIKKTFPNAKFIFIHRNPNDSLSSFFKAVKLILKKQNLYTTLLFKNYKKVYENPLLLFLSRLFFSKTIFGSLFLTKKASKAVNIYLKDAEKLSKDDFISIKYEDLCKETNKTIEKILSFLDLKSKDIDFSRYIKTRETKHDTYVLFLQGYIYRKMKNYFKEFSYDNRVAKSNFR